MKIITETRSQCLRLVAIRPARVIGQDICFVLALKRNLMDGKTLLSSAIDGPFNNFNIFHLQKKYPNAGSACSKQNPLGYQFINISL
jgi:hypothetical protein